jgi:solute carrier family 8 (sodium/calcium exchanger)
MYLFLGISLIADLFMEAIEVITSTTKRVEVTDESGQNKFFVEVPVWNATIANLSLMALGSSAPEILLSVVETCGKLGEEAGSLGPSTIVGSAAFNLLFISAVCIPAVDEPKKIADMGVFVTTALFSLFAYLWLYICLQVTTPGYVTRVEGWLTLGFFFLLLILAFSADKYNQRKLDKEEKEEEKVAAKEKFDMNAKKTHLRTLAKQLGTDAVIQVAQGIHSADTEMVNND